MKRLGEIVTSRRYASPGYPNSLTPGAAVSAVRPRESGDPGRQNEQSKWPWVSAFAGTSGRAGSIRTENAVGFRNDACYPDDALLASGITVEGSSTTLPLVSARKVSI